MRSYWGSASLLIAVALVFGVIAAPASSSGDVAVAAKKCKKKRHHKRKCKKKTQGAGDQGAPYVPPRLTISPTSHGFGSQLHNTQSSTFTFTITNSGGFNMAITFRLSGPNADQFLFVPSSNTCIGQVPMGASCQLGIKFGPTSTGAKSATLSATGLYDVTATAALSGTGT